MARCTFQSVIGPRVQPAQFGRSWARHLLPLAAFLAAGLLLLASTRQPYWRIRLRAPQYPKGLAVKAYVTHLSGDVQELDNLNHYIGMKKLDEGGRLERAAAVPMLMLAAVLLAGAAFVHSRWAVLLALPALLFPLVFIVDLQAWLWYFGHNLDKTAALSSSIKPFTPKAIGLGLIGQFKTYGSLEVGYWMGVTASAITFVGLVLHRRAYKPLVESAAYDLCEATA